MAKLTADPPTKPPEAFRAAFLETLVELYLRLNGYFCVRGYLQHRITGFGLHTESDVLALRMPYQHELLEDRRLQQNDPAIILGEDLVDCVIAEVKEPSVEFNKPIRGNDGAPRIEACLRMFGVLPEADFEQGGAGHVLTWDLHRQIVKRKWLDYPQAIAKQRSVCVRMIVFAPETAKHSSERKHLDLQYVLNFTRNRMRPEGQCAPYRDPAVPSGSPWRGLTNLIVQILDSSYENGEPALELEELIRRAHLTELAKK